MSSSELRYTRAHCWVREEGDEWVVGLSDFAQEQLAELSFVELPEVGEHVDADAEVAVVESVKAANDIYSPAAGTIAGVNEVLAEQPELINQDPLGRGWLFRMKPDHPDDFDNLMDADAYESELPDEDD